MKKKDIANAVKSTEGLKQKADKFLFWFVKDFDCEKELIHLNAN